MIARALVSIIVAALICVAVVLVYHLFPSSTFEAMSGGGSWRRPEFCGMWRLRGGEKTLECLIIGQAPGINKSSQWLHFYYALSQKVIPILNALFCSQITRLFSWDCYFCQCLPLFPSRQHNFPYSTTASCTFCCLFYMLVIKMCEAIYSSTIMSLGNGPLWLLLHCCCEHLNVLQHLYAFHYRWYIAFSPNERSLLPRICMVFVSI